MENRTSTNDSAILVVGATGRQGGAVARHLLAAGKKVRVLTRNPVKASIVEALGAEIVAGDLLDRGSLDAALKGVKRMYLVTTPYEAGTAVETQQGMNAAEAAKAAGVEHLVYSSVGSAHRNTGIPHFESKWKVEQHIRELGIPATILRPVWFMDNLASASLLASMRAGKVTMPLPPTRKLAMIAVENIGEYAAAAFLRPQDFLGAEIELAGDELTIPEAMALVSKATGRTINYEVMPFEQAEQAVGRDRMMMFKWFDEVGYICEPKTLRKKWGIPLTRFAEYVAKADWVKQLQQETKSELASVR
jgi:uncharacterized protein YbjT (DUF2867 family)